VPTLVQLQATALAHDADLLTCDRHFENLPGVRFVPKTGA
jgi:predicted nucleic acid-binding protein